MAVLFNALPIHSLIFYYSNHTMHAVLAIPGVCMYGYIERHTYDLSPLYVHSFCHKTISGFHFSIINIKILFEVFIYMGQFLILFYHNIFIFMFFVRM